MDDLKVILEEIKKTNNKVDNIENKLSSKIDSNSNELKEDIKYIKVDQEEHYKILRGLEHSSETRKAEIEGLITNHDQFKNDIDNILNLIADKIDKQSMEIKELKLKLICYWYNYRKQISFFKGEFYYE